MAAMNVDVWDDGDALQRLVDGRLTMEPQTLREGMSIALNSHMEHEAAAFNFVVGIVLRWVAVRPLRAGS